MVVPDYWRSSHRAAGGNRLGKAKGPATHGSKGSRLFSNMTDASGGGDEGEDGNGIGNDQAGGVVPSRVTVLQKEVGEGKAATRGDARRAGPGLGRLGITRYSSANQFHLQLEVADSLGVNHSIT